MHALFNPRRTAALWLGVPLLLVAALLIFGLLEAIRPPVRREMSIGVAQWPAGEPSLRIALLGDIHLGNRAMSSTRLRTIVREVNEARPDLVLIAGDFVVGHTPDSAVNLAPKLQAPLAGLRARWGAVAVLGNHDYWTSPASVETALTAAGVTVLENRTIRRGPLSIVGIGDRFSGHADVRKALATAAPLGGIPVVLTHSPDVVHELPSGFPLVLAGHTHCGQVVLPLFGPVLTRSPFQHWARLYDAKLRCGAVWDNGRLVIVTAGLGSGSSPIRVGAPPDWWLVTLRAR
jgi:predicted MPP superfamily phosphohydrolase